MSADPWLVLAPYVVERRVEGRDVFISLDPAAPRRAAVVASSAVRRVLQEFRRGATLEVAARSVPADSRSRWRAAVEELRHAGLLVGSESLGRPTPSLELEITNRCNADCVMCPRRELRPLGSMTEETFARVEALARSASGAILSGIGEPTLHPGLVRWCGQLRTALPEGAPLVVVTNGARMTPALFDDLAGAGVSLVQFSLHSLDTDRSNRIMRWSRHDAALANFIAAAERRPDLVAVNMVLLEANTGEVEAMRRFLAGLGLPVARLGLIPVFSRAGTVDPAVVTIGKRPVASGYCLYVRKALFVAWNGDLLPCSNDIRGEHPWGNVHSDDPAELVDRWWRELVTVPAAFDICRSCDHHTRETFPSGWFQAARR